MDMIKCIGLNKNTTHQNIWDATKVILKVKFTALFCIFPFIPSRLTCVIKTGAPHTHPRFGGLTQQNPS